MWATRICAGRNGPCEGDVKEKLPQSGVVECLTTPLTLAVLVLAAWMLIHPIAMSMPYPRDIDEHFVLDTSGTILKPGDPNPHFFVYPSLPTYTCVTGPCGRYLVSGAGGMGAGTSVLLGRSPRVKICPREG